VLEVVVVSLAGGNADIVLDDIAVSVAFTGALLPVVVRVLGARVVAAALGSVIDLKKVRNLLLREDKVTHKAGLLAGASVSWGVSRPLILHPLAHAGSVARLVLLRVLLSSSTVLDALVLAVVEAVALGTLAAVLLVVDLRDSQNGPSSYEDNLLTWPSIVQTHFFSYP
jgi:hypothetical protein